MVRKTLFLLAALILAYFAGPAFAKDNAKAWLDGKVVAVGHVTSSSFPNSGEQIPTATVLLLDPENANPFARQQVWVITTEALASRTAHVDLSVGVSLKAYRAGETSRFYGSLVIQYVDDKGREKGEWHPIVQALDVSDLP